MRILNKNNTTYAVNRFFSMKYSLVLEGALVGIFASVISVVYRYMLSFADTMLSKILSICKGNPILMISWILILVLMALIVRQLLKWQPMISGSGIPQVEGEMQGYIKPVWWKIILGKLVGGFLCILGGLSLGREGPSIQLGAMSGKGISRLFKRLRLEERFLITCGASAGLSAAFNAPLAGVMFALEEIHKNFSPLVMMSAMTASVIADFISKSFFGIKPVFAFGELSSIPLNLYWLVILLGILSGVLGAIYNKSLLLSQDIYKKIPLINDSYKIVIPFVIAGLLGFVMPEVLGGGHHMITELSHGNMLIRTVLILLVVKFLFSMISFGSGAPGGIFFPLLVLGAYIGGAFGMFFCQLIGFDTTFISNFIILAMAGYFTAIVRAPMTGIILICEMTGSFTHILTLSLVSITAYIVADILKSVPVYDSLLERILIKLGKNQVHNKNERIITETTVDQGSTAVNKQLKELALPKGCLIISIKRGEQELIPSGDTRLLLGDVIVSMYTDTDSSQIEKEIAKLTSL